MRIPVGEDWLGRVCNGRGEPLDGGPPIVGERDARRSPASRSTRRDARGRRRDAVLTGISAIDGLATLVRGQKLPIFSVGGLPHLELAAQVAAQAHGRRRAVRRRLRGDRDHPRRRGRRRRGARGARAAPATSSCCSTRPRTRSSSASSRRRSRSRSPSTSPSTRDRHVLVVMADLTSYCEALREVAAARGEIPSRRGYPGHLYSDLASLLERAGRIEGAARLGHPAAGADDAGRATSATRCPTPPATSPRASSCSRPSSTPQGVYPPFDALGSLSRLMRLGAGPGPHARRPPRAGGAALRAGRRGAPRARAGRGPRRGGAVGRRAARARVRRRDERRVPEPAAATRTARSRRRSSAAGASSRGSRARELTMLSDARARRRTTGARA